MYIDPRRKLASILPDFVYGIASGCNCCTGRWYNHFPFTFNAGMTSSAIDLAAASAWTAGQNVVTFKDGADLTYTVTMNGEQHICKVMLIRVLTRSESCLVYRNISTTTRVQNVH
ncbi:CIC11C00000002104 [Sungouiella intermedia]|uniref:CIC11C00000002104 n=1 Tax=Sungouiella intermedia TaxID=45354 RepID=A0A1L0C4P3_9ASCO|nr:CIC11C00000002104 [[Candida] intermedia]